ncbi:MAG: UTP--glucose-1-phosphate uridylyltransferase [Oligoflexia bacterium]|nr:UTP--glucose-1-phosphate uridylyltransferase [Oligoflexia bacterium]
MTGKRIPLILCTLFFLFLFEINLSFSSTECSPRNFSLIGQNSKSIEIRNLVEQYTHEVNKPKRKYIKNKIRKALGVDEVNLEYFLSLYEKKINPKAKETIYISSEGKIPDNSTVVFPTAIASKELMSHLPYVGYSDLQKNAEMYQQSAKGVAVWVKKMQAGTGSSMTRSSYIAKLKKVDPKKVKIGAKGTDLYIEVGPKNNISIAEAQMLQMILEAEKGTYGQVILHDIVSSETDKAIEDLWSKPSFKDPTKSYLDLVNNSTALDRSGKSNQYYMPTVDESGKLSLNRTAPAGHGLFGVESLRAAFVDSMRPNVSNKSLVSVIGNGEDLSSSADPIIVGWMNKEKVPIAMITTEKTANDLKGGQIALVKRKDESVTLTIVEQAQAKEAGQQELFEKLGLEIKKGNQKSFFNTNMVMVNYEILVPKVKKLVDEIGEDEFMRIIAPDLIENSKEQIDVDQIVRKYIQLEGAMGSSFLNLDKFWREKYGEPLVHIVNIEKEHRTDFFSPIKSAFDYFMQFYSDRFVFNPKTMRLENKNPNNLPFVSLKDPASKDKYYQDVQNVLDSFQGTSIIKLDNLSIEGTVNLSGATLVGDVRIVNKSSKEWSFLDWKRKEIKSNKLENVSIVIEEDGSVHISEI